MVVITLLLTCLVNFPEEIMVTAESQASLDDQFSIIQITDTQYLSQSFPKLFDNLTTWIANNSNLYNLKMVVHTGDIVDNWNSTSEWINANNSMSILLNHGIPYCWNSGNHDQRSNNPNLDWAGSNYLAFNGTFMASKSYWVESVFNSKNTAVQFSFNSYNFLIINVEYSANSSVFAWMKSLLDNSSGSNVIIATHDYLNSTAGYGFYENPPAWENKLNTLLNEYSNIFLTLSGHDFYSGANKTRINNREEIFFNRQSFDNTTGAATARIYTFDMTSMQVIARTYVIYDQTFLTDPFNQFTFDVSSLIPYASLSIPSNSPPPTSQARITKQLSPSPTPIPTSAPSPTTSTVPTIQTSKPTYIPSATDFRVNLEELALMFALILSILLSSIILIRKRIFQKLKK